MLRFCILLTISTILFLTVSTPIYAIENPLAKPNNKVGVHILFPSEIEKAASLVNANGGKWGYVTIPIRANDRDGSKWQAFLNTAKKLHVIPIIRLATSETLNNSKIWRKPTYFDLLDFANFLSSLQWPVKNRYIVVFNEPNRADEWGGKPDPKEYAEILSNAESIFKQKNDDFFIISAGLDNAAETAINISYSWQDFLTGMHKAIPGIFNQIDGISSHSYPNPAFAESSESQDPSSVLTFKHETDHITKLGAKVLPVFITETGWSTERVSEDTIASNFENAFANAWNSPSIVAITPFLLRADSLPFSSFSLLKIGDSPTKQYDVILKIAKIKGEPTLTTTKLGTVLSSNQKQKHSEDSSSFLKNIAEFIPQIMKKTFANLL